MPMNRTTKFFSFFFFFFIFTNLLISFSLPGYANKSNIANPIITADHLLVNPSSFQDIDPSDGIGQIHLNIGGKDLLAFKNLGQYAYDKANNKILYKAQALFGVEGAVYTTVSVRDIDQYFSVSNYKERTYLTVDKFASIYDEGQNIAYYKAGYYDVAFSVRNKHQYNGYFPVEVGMKPLIGWSGHLDLNGYSFEMPSLVDDVVGVKIVEVRTDFVGLKEDIFVDYNEKDSEQLEIVTLNAQTNFESELKNWINKQAHIGWTKGDITDPITLQNWEVSGWPKGTTCDNTLSSTDKYVFNLKAYIQPEITETRQYNKLTSAKIKWDWHDVPVVSPSFMIFTYGPTTKQVPRRVACDVRNPYIYYRFEIKMDLYMTVQPDHVLSESELDSPFFESGAWVWDTTYQGDIPTLPDDTFNPFTGVFGIIFAIIFLIIIGLIIVILIKTLPFIILNKTRRKLTK